MWNKVVLMDKTTLNNYEIWMKQEKSDWIKILQVADIWNRNKNLKSKSMESESI